jgi:hypothetical protein
MAEKPKNDSGNASLSESDLTEDEMRLIFGDEESQPSETFEFSEPTTPPLPEQMRAYGRQPSSAAETEPTPPPLPDQARVYEVIGSQGDELKEKLKKFGVGFWDLVKKNGKLSAVIGITAISVLGIIKYAASPSAEKKPSESASAVVESESDQDETQEMIKKAEEKVKEAQKQLDKLYGSASKEESKPVAPKVPAPAVSEPAKPDSSLSSRDQGKEGVEKLIGGVEGFLGKLFKGTPKAEDPFKKEPPKPVPIAEEGRGSHPVEEEIAEWGKEFKAKENQADSTVTIDIGDGRMYRVTNDFLERLRNQAEQKFGGNRARSRYMSDITFEKAVRDAEREYKKRRIREEGRPVLKDKKEERKVEHEKLLNLIRDRAMAGIKLRGAEKTFILRERRKIGKIEESERTEAEQNFLENTQNIY